MKLAYWDEGAYLTELAVSMPTPAVRSSSKTAAAALAADPGIKSAKDGDKSSNKKRKAQPEPDATVAGVKKPAPSHLQFWSNRHAELHGIKKKSQEGEDSKSTDGNSSSESSSLPILCRSKTPLLLPLHAPVRQCDGSQQA